MAVVSCTAKDAGGADATAQPHTPYPPLAAPGLLPDVGGRITVAALAVNSARRAGLRNAATVTNLVNGLPLHTRFAILTNDRVAFSVARNDFPQRVRFVELPAESPITIWPQDPFLVLHRGGETLLLTSKTFERADDRVMAAALAQAEGFAVEPSRLSFEGGNVVSDHERILIGANTVRYNALELDVPETEVVLRFESELGRPALVVGPVPQPVGHIDMAITPLGGGRIAVADAAAGARIAEAQLEDDPAAVAAFERLCEEQFFGHPAIASVRTPEGIREPPEVRGVTADAVAASRDVAPLLDGIASSLAASGYRVERIPFLFGGPGSDLGSRHRQTDRAGRRAATEGEGGKESGADEDHVATYPMLTYNNVLLEDSENRPSVYLPRYGWPAMDEAARAAWSEIGFEPHPIEGLTISAMYGGSLRCSVKVLER